MSHTLKRLLGLALTLLLCLTMVPAMAESCAHPEPYLEYSTTVKSDVPPAPVDVSYHSTTGDLYETAYCHYCCETVSETLLESNHTAMDNHYLTGGICDACGYETFCEHPAEMVEVSTFIQYSDYPVKVDDYQHSGTGTRFADYYCAECMCRFDCNTILEENTTVFEDHYFFTEDGTCAYCGCENPCTHASTYSYNEYADPAGYTPLDEMYHTYSGEGYVITRCSLCESIVSTDPLDTSAAENEPHYYMDNVCCVCGYTNTCTHPEDSLQNWNYIANQTYEYISDKVHKVSGTLIISKDCMLCGQSLGESIEDENYVAEERHNFYGADSNCYGCGVTNPCPHPEESRLSDSFMAETLSITCDDEKYHTAVGTMCYLEQCLRCGTYVSETYMDDQSLRSVHYFHNGVCDCGFENSCEHPADRLREDIGYTHNRAEAISATQHTGEVTKNVQTICTLCHESLPGVITSNETLTSNHIFSGGVCWACNYVNECTHPESARKDTTVIYSHDYTVVSSDADTHTLFGQCYASTQCSDCGESLSGKYVNDGTATEPHDFLNGICCICNAAE